VQGLRERGRIDDVIIGAAPFVLTMLLMIAALWFWPALALWIPGLVSG
jgi:TRAP-type C4-dicarboxylate transport system permease large subunit